ncbi:MAG: zonular occludens toxin domain-containing protein [archaeon]
MAKRKKQNKFVLLTYIWLLLKYIGIGIYMLFALIVKGVSALISLSHKRQKEKKQQAATAYAQFGLLSREEGSLTCFERMLLTNESSIGIVIGARGSGKTAAALRVLENVHAKSDRQCYALGFSKGNMPSWMTVVESQDDIHNGGFVVIDEGGILFNSRQSFSTPNKLLGNLMLIARHKSISILFVSQNSSNLDVNILRQADYLLLKRSSLLQERFERKIVGKIYEEKKGEFKQYVGKGTTYVYADSFRGFITVSLPSFWTTTISKQWEKK